MKKLSIAAMILIAFGLTSLQASEAVRTLELVLAMDEYNDVAGEGPKCGTFDLQEYEASKRTKRNFATAAQTNEQLQILEDAFRASRTFEGAHYEG